MDHEIVVSSSDDELTAAPLLGHEASTSS